MPTLEELQNRIRSVAEFNGGKLPVEHALVWEGYIAALVEWQLLSIADHDLLFGMLGRMPLAPGLSVALGPEGAQELMTREGISDLVATRS